MRLFIILFLLTAINLFGQSVFEESASDVLMLKHRRNDEAKENAIRALHRQHNVTEQRRLENIPWTIVKLPPNANYHALRKAYRESGLFEVVQSPITLYADQRGTLTNWGGERMILMDGAMTNSPTATPNDLLYPQQWGPAKIQAPLAWDRTTGSTNVVVVVMDTGIDFLHKDLRDNLWTASDGVTHGYTCIGGTIVAGGQDDHYHGTHCAGSIGAVGNNALGIVGLNWKVQLLAMKFLSSAGAGNSSDAAILLDKMVSLKKSGVNIRVSSHSWGGSGFDSALVDAFRAAQDADILNVCAAGNSNQDIGQYPFSPASFELDGLLVVLASDQNDVKATFSNFGWPTDIFAPGVNILSTQPGDRYQYLSGTSMACPHAAGVAAAMFAVNPALTAFGCKNVILNSNSYDRIGFTFNSTLGGRINMAKCVNNPLVFQPPTNVNHSPILTLNVTNNPQVIPSGGSFDVVATGTDADNDGLQFVTSLTSEQDYYDYLNARVLGWHYRTNVNANHLVVSGVPLAVDVAPKVNVSVVDGKGGGASSTANLFVYRNPTLVRDLSKAVIGWTARAYGDNGAVIRLDIDTAQVPLADVKYAYSACRPGQDFAESCCLTPNQDAVIQPLVTGVNAIRAQVMDVYGNFYETDQVIVDLGNTGGKAPRIHPVINTQRGAVPLQVTLDMTATENTGSDTIYQIGIWKLTTFSFDTKNPVQKFPIDKLGTWAVVGRAINQASGLHDRVIRLYSVLPMDTTEPPSTNPPPAVLTPPTGLTATDGNGRINLTWVNHAVGATTIELQQSVKTQGPWKDLPPISLPANATSYTLTAGKGTYSFRLRACTLGACGALSTGASIRIR